MERLKLVTPDSPSPSESDIRLTMLDNENDNENDSVVTIKKEIKQRKDNKDNRGKMDIDVDNEPATPAPKPRRRRLTIGVENEIRTCSSKLIAFERQLKVLYAGITTICEYLTDKFGVEIIDKSLLMEEYVSQWNEIQELAKSMSILSRKYNDFPTNKNNPQGLRRSSRQVNAKWATEYQKKRKKKTRVQLPNRTNSNCLGKKSKKNAKKNIAVKNEDSEESVLSNLSGLDADDHSSDSEAFSESPESKKSPSKSPSKSKVSKNEVDEDYVASESEDKQIPEKIETKDEDTSSGSESSTTNIKDTTKLRKRRKKKLKRSKSVDESENENEAQTKRGRGRPKKKPEDKAIHPDKIPQQCAECGKILKGSGSLKSHMNMHADLRPYPCPEPGCGKRFRVKNKLTLHLLIHKGEKTEQCRFCGRLFFFLKDLERHERTHTGERPFRCPQPNCSKTFNVKQHLTLHLRVHTGEKPYHCAICDKSFSQANSLRIHKKIHERDNDKVSAPAAESTNRSLLNSKKKGRPPKPKKPKLKKDSKIQQQPKPVIHPPDPVVLAPRVQVQIPVSVPDRVLPAPLQKIETLQPNQLPISILEPTHHHHPRPAPEQNELLTFVIQNPSTINLAPVSAVPETSTVNSGQLQFILTPTTHLITTPQIITSVQETWKLQSPQPTVIASTSMGMGMVPFYGIGNIGTESISTSNRLPVSIITPRNAIANTNISLNGGGGGTGRSIIHLTRPTPSSGGVGDGVSELPPNTVNIISSSTSSSLQH